nr:hypothetical protein Ade03nite_47920 [Actinoplanes derwentensis]
MTRLESGSVVLWSASDGETTVVEAERRQAWTDADQDGGPDLHDRMTLTANRARHRNSHADRAHRDAGFPGARPSE